MRTKPPAAVRLQAEPASGRRRSVSRVQPSSDERRFVGMMAGLLLGIVGALGVWWTDPSPSRRAPGPLTLPHAQAALTCASCHQSVSTSEASPSVAPACVGCHGSHASTRAGHQRLRAEGRLGCPDCHRVHRDFGGVRFEEAGGALRFGPGRVIEADDLGSRVHEASTVAIVPAGACEGCHDLERPTDPIARCLLAGQEGLGAQRPTVCFDEHQSWREAALGTTRPRLPAWEAAREVAIRHPVAVGSRAEEASWSWLGLALGLVGVGWAGGRAVRSRGRRAVVAKIPSVEPPAVRRLPQVNTATCIGCNACVDACPYDVLELRRYVAVVARPDDCCGLTTCQERCPNGSLVVTDGAPIEERPRMGPNLESLDRPGVFLAGDLTGLPLIRNAINQGALAVRSAAASLRGSVGDAHPDVYDLVIIGAGPAGLSASLEAKAAGLRHVVLEQGSVAESIRSFPRGKLVFDQPLDVPLVGELWLRESTKEELLGHWLRIVRRHDLPIVEGHRVVGLSPSGHGLLGVRAVSTAGDGPGEKLVQARAVIVAIGRRGSPRKLSASIPEAVAHRVHYSLADARSFAGRRVVVIGLGDVAMETAIALAGQPGTQVTIVHRGDGFRRGKRRNIETLERLVRAGKVEIVWQAEVESVGAELMVRTAGGSKALAWDAAFVMIGSIAPWRFLEGLGISRTGGG